MNSDSRWKIMLYVLSSATILVAAFIIVAFFTNTFSRNTAMILSFILGLLIATAIFGIVHLITLTKEGNSVKQGDSTMDDIGSLICNQESRMARVFKKCEKTMEEEKPYLRKGLTVDELASMVGTNRTYLSRTLNQMGTNGFCYYVNSYRIRQAKKLIQENPDLKVEDVSSMVGFIYVGTFSDKFKDMEKISPREYIQMIRDKRDFGV